MRTQALIALLVVAALGVIGGGYLYFQSSREPPTTYYGVALEADGKPEVKSKLGTPITVVDYTDVPGEPAGLGRVLSVGASGGDPNTLPQGRDFEGYNDWGYKLDAAGDIRVSFRKSTGKVTSIGCYSLRAVRGECEPLLGINIGDDADSVEARLGRPTDQSTAGVVKTLVYQHFHLLLLVRQQRVFGIALGEWQGQPS